MANASFKTPPPVNEPVKSYAPGSPERAELKAELERQKQRPASIPLVIDGRHISKDATDAVVSPHEHGRELARASIADGSDVDQAIAAAVKGQKEWSRMAWEDRAAIFLKAADLLSTKYRAKMNAATMLGQSKTCFQAEIDAACELADFWRYNVEFMTQIYADQPLSAPGMWNRVSYRGLEGFVFAVTPFNFTSIALNLASAPALMGCSVVWKPAHTSLAGCWVGMQILEEAGIPPGVINMVHGPAAAIGDKVLASPHLSGLHFTGSTGTFNHLWRTIGQGIDRYRTYPRIVGETGGKDFVFAHPSADAEAVATALVRGAFEYQGQKCSAASRAYLPKSLWPKIRDRIVADVEAIKVGDPTDFSNFMGAVIDKRSFDKIKGYIDGAREGSDKVEILCGGECDASTGYFIRPTVLVAKDPMYRTMCEEIFGPVLTIYVYDDKDLDKTLALCDSSSPYALTGAVFAQDRRALRHMADALENAAGNFYFNDKPTGAVVGQQPFGGARASGTNDKAGSAQNLLRWTSVRTMKETFVPPTDFRYPHMRES